MLDAFGDAPFDAPPDDLTVLRHITTYATALRADLTAVEALQGLWIMNLLQKRGYTPKVLARELNTRSGEVTITRIKKRYADDYKGLTSGHPPPVVRLIDEVIDLAGRLADDDTLSQADRRRMVIRREMALDLRRRLQN
ncbi:hypothetical protein ACWDTT_10445 [Streptosporangium sandarakinum]